MGRPPPRLLPALLALTLVGLLLRLAAGASHNAVVIARDGITFQAVAELFLSGQWKAGLTHHSAPGFPLLLAGAGALAGGLGERLASVVSALAGAALVPAVGLLAARGFGARAALWAALLAASLPLGVELGGEILADGPYLSLLAWTLVCAQRLQEGLRPRPAAAFGAACCGAAAYFVRPEGLVVLAAVWGGLWVLPRGEVGRGPGRRAGDAAWMLLPAILALLPFLWFIQDHAVLGGTQAGEFKLTLKRNLPERLSLITPGLLGERLVEQGRLTLKALFPGLLLLPGLWLLPRLARARRLAWLLGSVGAALLLAFLLVRVDRRYGAQLALLALPHAGRGADALARRLARWRPAMPAVLAVLVLVAALPWGLRARHAAKASYREAGQLLRARGARRVLAHDPRAAYYGGAAALPLIHLLPDPQERRSAPALLRVAREQDADTILIRVEDPAGQTCARELEALLGRAPLRVRLPGTVPLDLWLPETPR